MLWASHTLLRSLACEQLTTEQTRCENVFHIQIVPQIPVFSYLGFPDSILTHACLFPFPTAPVKGDFALEIPVELSMAPVAKILIYAILPDGEMIADSANFDIEKCLPNKVSDLFLKNLYLKKKTTS